MVRAVWEYSAALVLLVSVVTWLAAALRATRSARVMAMAAAATVLIGLIPVGGVSLAGLVLSISPSLSVAGTALWAALAIRRITGSDPLGEEGTKRLALVILLVAAPVYVSFIGGLGPDIYDSGYGFTLWDVLLGVCAAVMFIRGSFLSFVLVACLAAHATGLFGSSNIFDTLVDAPALIASMGTLVMAAFPTRKSLPNRPWL